MVQEVVWFVWAEQMFWCVWFVHTYSNVIKDVIMGKDDVVFVGKQITEQQTCKVLEIFIFKTLRFLHHLSYKK